MVLVVMVLSGTHAPGQEASAAAAPFVRYDISSPKGAAQIPSLQKGTLEMMKLDCKGGKTAPACESEAAVMAGKPVQTGVKADGALSPLGWKYQASIHGSLPGATDQTGWDTCEHSTWFFLSWHRMELYFFERILRQMSGDPKFTLPYWNFSVPAKGAAGPDGYGARLPASYRTRKLANGDDNPLFWPYRNSRLNMAPPAAGADPAWPVCGSVVVTKDAFAQTVFFTNTQQKGGMSFGGGAKSTAGAPPNPVTHLPGGIGSGQIEQVPHNALHGTIGTGLPGLPGSPASALSLEDADGAGLDPMFWPFHVNIDRSWACWQQKHKGTEPKSDFWLQRKFTFYDVQAAAPGYKEVTMTGAEVIATAAQLQYQYDDACQNFDSAVVPGAVTAAANDSAVDEDALSATGEYSGTLGAEPVTVTIQLPSQLQLRLLASIAAHAPRGSILLTIGGLTVDQPSGAAYGIYLNLPEGAAPGHSSASYVSELSFFGIGHHMHLDSAGHPPSGGSSITYDVTDAVRRLMASGNWPGNRISVTFAHPDAVPADCVQPGTASPGVSARFNQVTLTVD
jgi:tyrosinase